MNSTLNIYSNCKIIPSKNFKVDFIESYLATLTKATILDFQYVKHSLQVQIKVDMSQTGLTFSSDFNANYVSIKNGTDGTIVYYFVKNKRWIAEHTIAFDLFMDTINSFNDSITISPKTKILRQHLDRYQKISSSSTMVLVDKETIDFNWSWQYDILRAYDFQVRKPSMAILDLDNQGFTEIFATQPTAVEYYVDLEITFSNATGDGSNIKYYAFKRDLSDIILLGNNTITTSSPMTNRLTKNGNTWKIKINQVNVSIPQDYYLGILNDDNTAVITQFRFFMFYQTTTTHPFENISLAQYVRSKKVFDSVAKYVNGISGTAKPLIDMYSEGIVPKLYGRDLEYLNDVMWNQDWFLFYANQNDPSESLVNPVDCYLVGKHREVITNYDETFVGAYYGDAIANAIVPIEGNTPSYGDQVLYLHGIFQNGCEINGYMSSVIGGSEIFQRISVDNNSYLIMYRDVDPQTSYNWLVILKVNYAGEVLSTYCINMNRNGDPMADTRVFGYTAMVVIQKGNFTFDPEASTSSWLCTELMGSQYSFSYLNQLSQIDRTNPKIIKCIELPYFPSPIVKNTHIVGYRLTTYQWNTDLISGFGRVLKIRSAEEKLARQMNLGIVSLTNPFKPFSTKNYSVASDGLKSIDNEPKLFNSDYYQPKFVYDSFGFIFQLELITSDLTSLAENNSLDLTFTTTTTINSRFMFTFNDYVCENKELQDYNNIMCISRNNELPLYNQQYINYLRAGYNYDVKNKQRTEAFSWLGAGLSMAGAVASFASTGITGGFGVAMGISFTASALGTIANAINTTITQEQNFEIKQKQLQLQTTSVFGSDDVDLMNAYAHNRLKLKLYEVSPRMKQLLFDLFFYTGYVSNTLGLPNTTSRTRFNFVACELVFEQTPNISEEIIDDIKNRYNIGLTFLHRYNNTWDFEQKYENWETALVQ